MCPALRGEEFEKNHDASIIWEAHRVGRDKAYCHIEKLTNLISSLSPASR